MGKLTDKIILITGASRGIGAAVAKLCAKEGAQTVLVARSTSGLEKIDDEICAAGGLKPVLVPLDVTEGDKVDALGPSLYERFGRLDGLVGNAGVLGELGPLTHQMPKNWQKVIDTNLTANWRLLRICDPLLQRAAAGRVVMVTSGIASGVYPYWGPYAVSKAALEMMTKIYEAEVAQTNIKVTLLDPGEVRTDMHAAAMPGIDPMTLPHPDEIAPRFVKALV
jgi:NAD(P)-dependent dehydrogenase (short-subunit alcohol dehydrogenase family)